MPISPSELPTFSTSPIPAVGSATLDCPGATPSLVEIAACRRGGNRPLNDHGP
jgi:hypothetical protein